MLKSIEKLVDYVVKNTDGGSVETFNFGVFRVEVDVFLNKVQIFGEVDLLIAQYDDLYDTHPELTVFDDNNWAAAKLAI
jgi:hypothetical protein